LSSGRLFAASPIGGIDGPGGLPDDAFRDPDL